MRIEQEFLKTSKQIVKTCIMVGQRHENPPKKIVQTMEESIFNLLSNLNDMHESHITELQTIITEQQQLNDDMIKALGDKK